MRDHAVGAFGVVGARARPARRGVGAARERLPTPATAAFAAAPPRARAGRRCRSPRVLPYARSEGQGRSACRDVALRVAGRARRRRRVRARRRAASTASPSLAAAAATALVLGLFFRRWHRRRHRRRARRDDRARAGCRRSSARAARLVTRLLLIRHAQPDDDARGRCYGRLDVGLVSRGGRGRRPSGSRGVVARRSATVVLEPTSSGAADGCAARRRPRVDERLRELDFGELEGRTYEEIERERPELFRRWMESPTQVRVPGRRELRGPARRVPSRRRRRAPRAPRRRDASQSSRTAAWFARSSPTRSACPTAAHLPARRRLRPRVASSTGSTASAGRAARERRRRPTCRRARGCRRSLRSRACRPPRASPVAAGARVGGLIFTLSAVPSLDTDLGLWDTVYASSARDRVRDARRAPDAGALAPRRPGSGRWPSP